MAHKGHKTKASSLANCPPTSLPFHTVSVISFQVEMEQYSPFGWLYYPQEEEMGELKRFLVQTTMELEATVLAAQDEILRKEEELTHMRNLLVVAVKERDEAQYKCQKLLLEKQKLQQQPLHKKLVSFPTIGTNNEENAVARDTKTNNTSFSSSDSHESTLSATPSSSTLSSSLPPNLATTQGKQRALPEKGKLLQAVMEAGPLLQTLLLAGPLPQWQHPPPRLERIDIPLVTMPSSSSPIADNFDGSVCSKYQRVA